MKTTKFFKCRWLTLCLFLLALSWLDQSPANAGHWEATHEWSGKQYVVWYEGSQRLPDLDEIKFEKTVMSGEQEYYANIYPSQFHNDIETWYREGRVYASITPILTWTPDFEGDTSLPPTKVYVIENAAAKMVRVGPVPSFQLQNSMSGGIIQEGIYSAGRPEHVLAGEKKTEVDNAGQKATLRLKSTFLSAYISQRSSTNTDYWVAISYKIGFFDWCEQVPF